VAFRFGHPDITSSSKNSAKFFPKISPGKTFMGENKWNQIWWLDLEANIMDMKKRQVGNKLWMNGFLGFLGFLGFEAFKLHDPWHLFYFSFFAFFAYFKYLKDELKYLALLSIFGLIAGILGITGLIEV